MKEWIPLHDWAGQPINVGLEPGREYVLSCNYGRLRVVTNDESRVVLSEIDVQYVVTFTCPDIPNHFNNVVQVQIEFYEKWGKPIEPHLGIAKPPEFLYKNQIAR